MKQCKATIVFKDADGKEIARIEDDDGLLLTEPEELEALDRMIERNEPPKVH